MVTWWALSGERVQKSHCMLLCAQSGVRQALLRVDEVGELAWVADEEHRGVVADQIEVALVGVELQRESPWVAHRVGIALLAGDVEKRANIGVRFPTSERKPPA